MRLLFIRCDAPLAHTPIDNLFVGNPIPGSALLEGRDVGRRDMAIIVIGIQ
jgi:hypothetical protein